MLLKQAADAQQKGDIAQAMRLFQLAADRYQSVRAYLEARTPAIAQQRDVRGAGDLDEGAGVRTQLRGRAERVRAAGACVQAANARSSHAHATRPHMPLTSHSITTCSAWG